MTILLLVLGLILFVGLVVVHEYGHFKVARRNGVDVEEFGVGLPPKVWGKKIKSGFEFSVNALPLGGFVRLKGENDADKSPGSFGAAPLWAKVKIMLAGVAMNLLVAYLMFLLLALIGMPKLVEDQFTVASDTTTIRQVENQGVVLVAKILEGSPADKAKIKSGDEIRSVNGEEINNPNQVVDITRSNAGEEIPIILQRGEQRLAKTVKLNDQDQGQGYLGVVGESGEKGIQIDRFSYSAPIVAGGVTLQFTQLTLKGIGTALGNLVVGNTDKASEQVAGPVGIFVLLREGTSLGLNFILMIIAIISLTLAIFNALPIPALDGGRLFVTLLYRAIRRPLTKSKENFIHGTGFVLLLSLLVLLTIVDVNRFF
jgi:regulator of sigma E protease